VIFKEGCESQLNSDHDHYSKIIREIFDTIEALGNYDMNGNYVVTISICESEKYREPDWYNNLKSKYLED
jgi:hypothetical protein